MDEQSQTAGTMAAVRANVEDAREQIAERMKDMPANVAKMNESFVGFVRAQPLVAIGGACVVGYVLGRMLRRVV